MAVPSVPLTHGGDTFLSSVAALNGRVFDTDPVIGYMLLDLSEKERLAYLPTYWSTIIKSALLNKALITEADGWKAASVIVPPGRYLDNVWTLLSAGFLGVLWRIGFPGFKRLWFEFSGMTDNAKRKGLRGKSRFYYVFSLGTEREHRGKGLAKAIMLDHQQTAQAANLPIWLEATTPSSRGLYLSMGFEEVEEILLGKGKVAADASLQPGGPGIPLWAMVWWPQPEKST
ncbi:Acyl-CoA N-acyltransferase [Penicillium paradoxum]|uniref:Acyl-CoA N-acyltransferase n=1 Tax=Penicillium paradoxum TaxID=176176 RepID=UPI00254914C6|nr:Acyl-CoA N-acyltransferase [Penicillium paradoxum]KAJ5788745.1 Acyl-CoA N-acyltransferase [Penicillium paradoxum]